MSEELTTTPTRATTQSVSTRVTTFLSSRSSGMWGVAELVAFSAELSLLHDSRAITRDDAHHRANSIANEPEEVERNFESGTNNAGYRSSHYRQS